MKYLTRAGLPRYAIHRDIFRSYRDTNVHGIYGDRRKKDGDRRKYTKSNSAGATSVRPYTLITHTVNQLFAGPPSNYI